MYFANLKSSISAAASQLSKTAISATDATNLSNSSATNTEENKTSDPTPTSSNWNISNLKSSIQVSASQLHAAASTAASQVIGEYNCTICKDKVSKTQVVIGMATYERCVVCGANECCKKCIKKHEPTDPIPSRIKHADYRDSSKPEWVCLECEPLVDKTFMEDFKKLFLEDIDDNLNNYFQNNEQSLQLHAQPGPIEDTTRRKLHRLAQVAEVIIDNIGFKYVAYGYKALKYAYMGTELYTLLISGDFLRILGPLGEVAKDVLGREVGARGIIYLYYLSSQQKLSIKSCLSVGNNSSPSSDFTPFSSSSSSSSSLAVPKIETFGLDVNNAATDSRIIRNNYIDPNYIDEETIGVISLICPLNVLDLVGINLNTALWLYITKLPKPHTDSGWSSWYLEQLIKRQNWTLIGCLHETTKLRNNRKCPAFAVVLRNKSKNKPSNNSNENISSTSSSTETVKTQNNENDKEIIILIRGSQSTMDWSLNLNEVPVSYNYYGGSTGDDLVEGKVHGGMLEGAYALLDDYGVRDRVVRLCLIHGYKITVIGHSLGAGVATFVTTELKITFHKKINEYMNNPNVTLHSSILPYVTEVAANNSSNNSNEKEYIIDVKIPLMISALAYAPPPVMTDELAQAVGRDKLIVNIVNSFDIVPRLSKLNVLTLIEEVKKVQPEAEKWYNEDLKSLQDYAYTLGKASDMSQQQHSQQSQMPSKTNSTATNSTSSQSAATATAEQSTPAVDATTSLSTTSVFAVTPTVTATCVPAVETDASLPTVTASSISTASITTTPTVTVTATSSTAASTAPVTTPKEIPPEEVSLSTLQEMIKSEIKLFIPGEIVYIYQDDYGRDQAALVDNRLPSLHRIMVIPERNLDDHTMKDHFTKLKNIRRHININSGESSYFNQYHRAPRWQNLYITADELNISQDINHIAANEKEKFLNHSTSTFNDTVSETAPLISTTTEHLSTTDMTTTTSLPETDAPVNENIKQIWRKCCVCENDTTWVNVLKSEGSRARNTHNCRMCGKIVCSICSPSGEKLVGDGVSESYTTRNWKISLPELGLWEPQRVCVHCYFDAYKALLNK